MGVREAKEGHSEGSLLAEHPQRHSAAAAGLRWIFPGAERSNRLVSSRESSPCKHQEAGGQQDHPARHCLSHHRCPGAHYNADDSAGGLGRSTRQAGNTCHRLFSRATQPGTMHGSFKSPGHHPVSVDAQVERLTAEVVRLKTEGEAQSGAQAQLKQDMAQKEEQLRTMTAERNADRAKARAEAQQLKDAAEKTAMAGSTREEQLRRELKALAARLERAQEINPPPSVVSASTLAIIFLALLATSALAFWFSAAKSARDQVLELEELRLQAEEQEVCAACTHNPLTVHFTYC